MVDWTQKGYVGHALTAGSWLQALQEQHKVNLENERQHYENLLKRARAAQVCLPPLPHTAFATASC